MSSSSDIDFGGEERPPWFICVILWSAAHVFYVYMEWPGHHIGCMQLQGFKPLLFNQDLLSYLVFFPSPATSVIKVFQALPTLPPFSQSHLLGASSSWNFSSALRTAAFNANSLLMDEVREEEDT